MSITSKNPKLNIKQQAFVINYLKSGNGKQAAIDSGYGVKSSQQTAYELLNHHPLVKAEIDSARKVAREEAKYSVEKAMSQAQEAYDLAKQCRNPIAMVKAAELKAKLSGLLIDKHEVKQVGFQIQISGVDDVPLLEHEAKKIEASR